MVGGSIGWLAEAWKVEFLTEAWMAEARSVAWMVESWTYCQPRESSAVSCPPTLSAA